MAEEAKPAAKRKTRVEENIKAVQFNEFLMEKGIQVFSTESMEDEVNTVFFRSRIEVGGQILPTVVIIDTGAFVIVRTQMVGGIGEEKRVRVMEYLNELNLRYKTFKYYLSPEGYACLDMCITVRDDAFDAELVYGMIGVLVQHLQSIYADFMEFFWTKE